MFDDCVSYEGILNDLFPNTLMQRLSFCCTTFCACLLVTACHMLNKSEIEFGSRFGELNLFPVRFLDVAKFEYAVRRFIGEEKESCILS